MTFGGKDKQCSGKKTYSTYFEARSAQRRLRGKKGRFYEEEDTVRQKMVRLTIYKCRYCHWWHLGRDYQLMLKRREKGDAGSI